MSALSQKLMHVFSQEDQVLLGDHVAIPDLLVQSGRYIATASTKNAAFNHEMLKIGISRELDLIVPLRMAEIVQLAECRELFGEYGIQLAVPSPQFLDAVEFIINPGKELRPDILLNGKTFRGGSRIEGLEKESGVCVVSDSGEEAFFCCLE